MQFSLEQLEAFVASAETGSFSAGARRLGKAQSVISAAVANLETDLNLTLFDRSRRSPVLTGHGEALLIKARHILEQCGSFMASAEEYQAGVETKITLAVESMTMTQTIADQLTQFEAQYPMVELEILNAAEGDMLELLESGRAQIALMIQLESLVEGFDFYGIGQLEMCHLVSPNHVLAQEKVIDWHHLKEHRQVLLSGRYRKLAHRWQLSDSMWVTDSALSAMLLVSSGIGWTVLPRNIVGDLIESGLLTELATKMDVDGWRQSVDVAYSNQKPMGPATKALLTLLKEIQLR
ncbi:LysR family transcriptional regulator [Photobacterium jeanii]|uniref:LysR family transcriptional regulator n=1 Tax=Photobacterium jeanii TaxID=858640 RepID=A0A178KBU8_9GAMM|nr:LysR family transcriptional regulator [Photobacterium jeanii]OAN14152.1 LysR family transcriptional regulator [Photobacterium jeanii]PST89671.1 LysR family transcriptional regulator [Photobacterium jeanii]